MRQLSKQERRQRSAALHVINDMAATRWSDGTRTALFAYRYAINEALGIDPSAINRNGWRFIDACFEHKQSILCAVLTFEVNNEALTHGGVAC